MKRQLITITMLASAFNLTMSAQDAKISIHTNQVKNKINKEIYGQFAEHLGSCIYGGLWVGPESKIPNINGYRKDVLYALKDLKMAGRLFC